MRVKTKTLLLASIASVALMGASAGVAKPIKITITNLQSSGGLALTPLFSAFHDGSFDTFDAGGMADSALETLAETGSPAGEVAAANTAGAQSAVITAPGGFAGAPVIEPGESASITIDLDTNNRYFSYLSMVIPSNDLFIGNDNATAYEIFDAAGNFTGLNPINISIGSVWDAGTELNNNLGAAFNTNQPTDATDTTDPIALVGDLSFLLNQGTPIGPITGIDRSLAEISFSAVPLPAAAPMALAGFALMGAIARRKKTARKS